MRKVFFISEKNMNDAKRRRRNGKKRNWSNIVNNLEFMLRVYLKNDFWEETKRNCFDKIYVYSKQKQHMKEL